MPFKSASLKNPMIKHPDEVSVFDNLNQETYQFIQFNNTQLPELNDWSAGDEYEIVLKVKLEKRIDSAKNEVVGDFKVLEVKVSETAGDEELSDEQKHYKEQLG